MNQTTLVSRALLSGAVVPVTHGVEKEVNIKSLSFLGVYNIYVISTLSLRG